MAFTILINGVDKTSSVDWDSFRKTDNLNQQVDTLDIFIKRYGASVYAPSLGQEVVVSRNGTTIFGGVIVRIVENVRASTIIGYKVQCNDYSQYLKRKLVTKTYSATTVSAIIADLISLYTTDGFTTANVSGLLTIKTVTFNRVNVADCLQKLADAISYVWYVDYNKDIHFFPKNTELASFNLSDSSQNYIYNSLEITEDLSQIRNSVLVQGGDATSATGRTEYLSGDGTRLQFALSNKFASLPVVRVGGVTKTVGVEYLNDDTLFQVMWNFNEKYLRFTAGNTPAAGTNNIDATQTYLYPIVVSVPAPASQVAYGIYEFAITDKTINSQDEAIARAKAELTSYQSTLFEGSFRTYNDGLKSGQVININSTQRGRNIDVLIQSVSVKLHDPLVATLEYDVRFATLKTIGIIKYLQDQLKPGDVIVGDQQSLLNFYPFTDTVGFTDSLAAPTFTSTPYVFGTAVMGYSTMS